MLSEEIVFGWICPKCHDCGLIFDVKPWKYCRFCGSKLKTEIAPGDPERFMRK